MRRFGSVRETRSVEREAPGEIPSAARNCFWGYPMSSLRLCEPWDRGPSEAWSTAASYAPADNL